jgi:phage portal protein BeeE
VGLLRSTFARFRQKASDLVTRFPDLTPGWWPVIKESFTGAWQRGIAVSATEMLTFSPVFSCITLIASDIAKLEVNLIELDSDGIWSPAKSSAFSPVLRRPNHYQNRIQFFMSWVISKLTRGNTYVLKERDGRGNVVAMYILDPSRVKPLVAPNGEVFYDCSPDVLAGLPESVKIPATEIIHDVMYAFFHPLCGLPPLIACSLAATQGRQDSAERGEVLRQRIESRRAPRHAGAHRTRGAGEDEEGLGRELRRRRQRR